jgi:hypothetical protein
MTQLVTDDATTYLWLCSDGETRITTTTTPPTSYDERTACILCRVVAASGTATVDLSVQQRARAASTGRYVSEGAGLWAGVPDTIPDACWAEVGDARQLAIMDALTVYGTLRVMGKARII